MPTLVVNQGALGDLFLSLPALRLIGRYKGNFTLAGEPERCLFLKASGEVSSVFPTNSAAFSQLYAGTIPPHLDYFDDIWWFTRRRGLVPTILMMPDSEKQAKVIFTVDEGPDETNCSLFQFEQVKKMLEAPEGSIHQFCKPLVYARSGDDRTGFDLAIHPGSGSPKKNLPVSFFLKVAQALLECMDDLSICFILGPAEADLVNEVEGFALMYEGSVKIASNFDLVSLSELLGMAKVYWGNDSGISHLAAWCGARTFINFGPTKESLWRPVCGSVHTFKSLVSCSPCEDAYRRCTNTICLHNFDEKSIKKRLIQEFSP